MEQERSEDSFEQIGQLAKRSKLAIWSLVLGSISVPTFGFGCHLGGIVATMLGIAALLQIREKPTERRGRGLAVAGIVTGSLSMAISIFAILPSLLYSRQAANDASALNRVRSISTAEAKFRDRKGTFADLQTLADEALIDSSWIQKECYGFTFDLQASSANGRPIFDATARPVKVGPFGTATRSFGENESWIVYEAKGSVILRGTPADEYRKAAKPWSKHRSEAATVPISFALHSTPVSNADAFPDLRHPAAHKHLKLRCRSRFARLARRL
jgi:hypothetical protein